MMGRFTLYLVDIQMRYLLILLVSVNLYSQDYITTLNGKTTEGKYIDLSETHLQFQQDGSNVVSIIPDLPPPTAEAYDIASSLALPEPF